MDSASPDIRVKIDDLLQVSFEVRVRDLKQSVSLATEALKLSKEADDKPLIAKSLSRLSLYEMILGENDRSIATAEEAIRIFQELGDECGIADAKYNIAGTLYKSDNFNLGLMYLRECLTVFKKYDDYYNQARTYKSMGTIYEYFGDTSSAINSYESCIQAGKLHGDKNLVSNAYNPLSGIYLNTGMIDRALNLIEKAIAMKKETSDVRGLAFALYGRGKVFTRMERFEEAESDFKEAIRIHEAMGERLGTAMTLRKQGVLYIAMDRLEEAKEVLHQGMDLCNRHKIALIAFNIYHLLYQIAKQEGETEKAIEFLEKYVKEKDQVINTRMLKIIESYEAVSKIEALEREALVQREKADIIEKKNLELDSFFYRVSHDLKGPITALTGLDFMARESTADPKTIDYLDKYKTQVDRISNILDELIKITRVNHMADAKEEIDFGKLVSDCIRSYQFLPNFDKVKITVSNKEPQYQAEWALINTIVQNLIENAIKYARLDQPVPEVNISIDEQDGEVVLVVEDNGLGMDEETRTNIFDMFYRGDPKSQGSGLGLYILKRAIEKLQGTVHLESEPYQGSRFEVRLPKSH